MESGGQPGNNNAAKAKQFYDGLRRALARSGKTVDGGLNKVCDQLVLAALDGQQWAIKEVADRIDGRPAQSLDVGNKPGETFDVTSYGLIPLKRASTDTDTE